MAAAEVASAPEALHPAQAVPYLNQFIGRNLRVHVSDNRMFIGQMKCIDKDRNVILALTHEFRAPTETAIRAAIAQSGDPAVQLPLTSRYVGLVVVPGHYITRIEYEESPWAPAPVVPPAPRGPTLASETTPPDTLEKDEDF